MTLEFMPDLPGRLPPADPTAPRDYWAAMASEGMAESRCSPTDPALAPLGYGPAVLESHAGRWYAVHYALGTPEERAAERERLAAAAASAAQAAWAAERQARVISPFQARAALAQAGLLAAVEALMADPATPEIARLAWLHAQEFRRNSPTLLALAGALGLDEAALEALFDAAATIVA